MSMDRWRPWDHPGPRRHVSGGHLGDRGREPLMQPFWAGFGGLQGYGLLEPAVDVFETDEHMVVKAELPGMDPRDLKVTVTEDSMSFRGETTEEREEKEEGYHWRERRHGLVQRMIPLARQIDPESARASFRNGVLTIRAQKVGGERSRTVDIEVESDKTGYRQEQ